MTVITDVDNQSVTSRNLMPNNNDLMLHFILRPKNA